MTYNVIVMKANRFMNGLYMGRDMVKDIYKGWNNTPHDINHMGTGYKINGNNIPSNIEYVIGYQNDLIFDEGTGEVRATMHIDPKSPKYDSWLSYVRICDYMGRTPNVSMFVKGKLEYVSTSDLPGDSGYELAGYKSGDIVPCMIITEPVAVSTVFSGSCSGDDGCGIIDRHSKTEKTVAKSGFSVKKLEWIKNNLRMNDSEFNILSIDDIKSLHTAWMKKEIHKMKTGQPMGLLEAKPQFKERYFFGVSGNLV